MFGKARIKLTGWYLLIIMGVSLFFSATIFNFVSADLEKRLFMNELRYNAQEWGVTFPRGIPRRWENLDPEVINKLREKFVSQDLIDAKKILLNRLIILNGVIFVFSSTLGYWLAGKTLRPIEIAMEKQKQFVSDASHELRTPLTSLRTDFEVTLRNKKLNLISAKKTIKDGLLDIEKLQILTDRLLVLAKNPTLLKLRGASNEKFDFKKLITEEIRKMKKIANKKDIEIISDLKSVEIMADKLKMADLIRILVDNAIKYSKKESKIWINLKHKNNHAILEVKDNGIGISKENLPLIFDRFYRVDESRSGSCGFGLGLAIAKKIVKEHGGKIEVISELGRGSLFRVRL